MAKVPPKNRPHGVKVKERRGLGITSVRYVPTPDAEARLSCAVDVLLRAATQNTVLPEEGVSDQKSPPKVKGDEEVKPDGA